jgi:hypothetical protein
VKHLFVFIATVCIIGCAPPAPATPSPTVTSGPVDNVFARFPAEIGAFKLTERSIVRGVPTDSVFRFSDGSPTTLTVFIYDVVADVKVEADSQKWTAREGEKFKSVQEIRRARGQIADFVMAFSDTTRFNVGQKNILEHAIAIPTRLNNRNVVVEMQYLYLIHGKFVKVRGTIPQQGWEKTGVPSFSRDLARRVAGGA